MGRRPLVMIAALTFLGAPLRAQATATTPEQTAAATATAAYGPTLASLSVAAHAPTHSDSTLRLPDASRAGLGQAKAMMIVGGAALLVGAIVGGTPGTIIMIGGAVVGLVGLYEFLQ